MALQMPMLLGNTQLSNTPTFASWNQFGLTGFIFAQLILTYWMLPISIDHAVVLPQIDVFKLFSLIACGAFIHDSLRRSPTVIQLFFVGYAVSMLISTGVF